jgi:hypothetical protein
MLFLLGFEGKFFSNLATSSSMPWFTHGQEVIKFISSFLSMVAFYVFKPKEYSITVVHSLNLGP